MDLSWLLALVQSFITTHPNLAVIFVVMGFLRAILKPVFTFAHAIADVTPSTADNVILDNVEKSKFYSTLSFILDYFASIKLP